MTAGVYFNGTFCMDVVDKKFSEVIYFGFWLYSGPAIDNVVVSDTIFITPSGLKINMKDSNGNTDGCDGVLD